MLVTFTNASGVGVQRQRAPSPGGSRHGEHLHGGRAADAAPAATRPDGGYDQRLGHHGLPRPSTDARDEDWMWMWGNPGVVVIDLSGLVNIQKAIEICHL